MQQVQRSEHAHLSDRLSFLRSWIERPAIVGAVAPSGPALAKTIASYVDVAREGPVVELGPGTGPVTKALLARGIPAERLILVEYETRFCHLLAERYPGVKIVQGDAYDLVNTLRDHVRGQVATVVSCLPILMRPDRDRFTLLCQCFELMGQDGLLVQFTYRLAGSPLPLHANGSAQRFVCKGSAPVLRNLPPARVWRYRCAGHAGAAGR
ncbi:MAG TPA: rRNA adenine N-6-methyltransferase family protein [Methylocystis sp.]|nr:rRNA adenine N-6-methyltransferase family protein [Methylocystis sp.]